MTSLTRPKRRSVGQEGWPLATPVAGELSSRRPARVPSWSGEATEQNRSKPGLAFFRVSGSFSSGGDHESKYRGWRPRTRGVRTPSAPILFSGAPVSSVAPPTFPFALSCRSGLLAHRSAGQQPALERTRSSAASGCVARRRCRADRLRIRGATRRVPPCRPRRLRGADP